MEIWICNPPCATVSSHAISDTKRFTKRPMQPSLRSLFTETAAYNRSFPNAYFLPAEVREARDRKATMAKAGRRGAHVPRAA